MVMLFSCYTNENGQGNYYMEYDYEKQENNEQDSEHLLDEQEARKMHRELDRLISSRRQEKRANGGRIAAIVIGGFALVVAASLIGFNVIHDSGYEYDYDDDESVYETVEGDYELPLDKGVSFTLDGIEMRLPVSLQTFLDMGWEIDENEYSNLPETITEDDYVTVDLRKGSLDLYSVKLDIPQGMDSCRGEEAEITRLSIHASEGIDFEDCFGISTTDDPDDVEDSLEDADITFDKYESDYSESYTVYMDAGDETGSLDYYIYDDEIDSISLSYYNYD